MTIKLAFAGTGYISKIHAQAAQKIPGVEIVAVVNHKLESTAAFAEQFSTENFGIARQYTTIEELLGDSKRGNPLPDAISINTPNYLHAPQTIAALEAGMHVMVEKPMAMNAAEGEAMMAASEKSGALLMVAHCWRFDEEVLWLKKQTGRIGEIVRTKGSGVHVNWGPGGWFTKKAYAGGGALADMGIHAVDTARFLLGDPQPESVYAKIGTYYGDYDVDDTGLILVNWDNGATSYIESGWWQPHSDGPEASTRLYGRNGLASLFPTYLSLPDAANERVETIESGFVHPRPEHCPQVMYDNQMAYFLACVRSGQTPSPGGLEGLVNMRIVDAAYESARTGSLVQVAG